MATNKKQPQEFKLTREAIHKMADKCSNAKALLKEAFPSAFVDPAAQGIQALIAKITSYEAACKHRKKRVRTLKDFAYEDPENRVSAFAQHKVTMISRAFNGNRKIDWSNSNQKIRFWLTYKSGVGLSFGGCSYVNDHTGGGAGLHFLDEEVCKHLKDQEWFISILRDAYTQRYN